MGMNLDNADNMGDAAKRCPPHGAPGDSSLNTRTNILLMGPRASGKTTLGRALGARLSRPFTDLDQATLQLFGEPSIADVWRVHGESAWRDAEASTLARVLRESRGVVIALGGGTPMIAEAQERLREAQALGEVMLVYLRCTAATLKRRLKADQAIRGADDTARPPLLGGDALTEVNLVLAAREPTYLRLADVVIDADVAAPEETLTSLLAAVERWAC
jgi:shikimate kinase